MALWNPAANALFLQAVNLPTPEERRVFLDQACGDNDELHGAVGALLEANERAGNFLEAPASGVMTTLDELSVGEGPGTVIGPYKLLQRIGEGGMGTVFLAEQLHPVQRKVALKVIKSGLDSRQVLARFEAEQQALALMDHPNIAKVFDAGTTGEPRRVSDRVPQANETRGLTPHGSPGRPYIVMELVKGAPITRYCDEQRLTPRERLQLFVPVCQAVQHAHQKGIIHRDLKPSNLLMAQYDGRPVPKVIDFGVAKAIGQKLTEHTLFTEFGQVVGTLEYMSPEQADLNQLDIDTRSDIYSLGVLLYELLTGTTPLERKRLQEVPLLEVLRLIKEEEPPTPSLRLSTTEEAPSIAAARGLEPKKLSRLMRGELDWIVIKALEKDRNRRYDTANGFALDVQRYLDDEPVLACPPSAGYRFRKFARRNKGLLVATGLILLTLVSGIIGTSWALIDARVQRGQARQGEVQAQQSEAQARQSEADTKAVSEFFEKRVLSAALTKGQGKQGQGLGSGATILDAVNKAEAGVAGAFQGRPLVEASIRRTLGRIYWDAGDFRRAIEQHEKALALRKAHLAANDPDTLESMNDLGQAFQSAGRLTDALPLLQETLKLRQAQLGPDHEETLWTMNRLAETLRALGRPAEALPLYEEALRVAKIVLGPDHQDTWIYMDKLAGAYQSLGRFAEAVALFEATLKLEKTKVPPDHPDLLVTSSNLALAYTDVGRWAEAEALGRETLPIKKAVFGFDHPDTLAAMNNLGNVYRDSGRPAEALPLLEEAVRLSKAKQGPDHYATLIFMGNLATVYRNLGRLAEALALFEETLRLLKAKLGADHPRRLIVMNETGECLLKMEKYDEAELLLRECLALRLGKDPAEWWVFQTRSQLGQAATGLKRHAEAEALLREAHQELAVRKDKIPARCHRYLGEAAQALADLYETLGKKDEAAQWRQ
jgi:serine/threonine protein kinase/tetratricopeptide (TPR) repeat protein